MGENCKTITGGREERSKCEEKEKDGGGGESERVESTPGWTVLTCITSFFH